MENRRTLSWIAAIGCGALLLMIAVPIALGVWAFQGGGFNFQLPQQGQNEPRTSAPTQQLIRPTEQRQTNQNQPQIPETGQNNADHNRPALQPPSSLAELYQQVSPGTVSILIGVSSGSQMGGGAGSGFILSEDGYIVTNDHVVEGGDQYIVRFFNEVDAEAQLIGADPDSDLAILKVDEMPEGTYPLALGDSSQIQVGDSVVAIGNPFALGTSMSYGIISAVGRTIPSITQFNIPEAIQTDAAINPGNSGGPLLNMNGEVIGVNAQIRTGSEGGGSIGIGFAIPVNILKQVYPSLIESGAYHWPYLGVSSSSEAPGLLQPDESNQIEGGGAVIAEVVPGGPAEQAGVQQGDVVIHANDQDINNFDDLLSVIAFSKPGDQLKITILRNGQEQTVTVTLGERPAGELQ
jgi:S1-C subfamily serine protease